MSDPKKDLMEVHERFQSTLEAMLRIMNRGPHELINLVNVFTKLAEQRKERLGTAAGATLLKKDMTLSQTPSTPKEILEKENQVVGRSLQEEYQTNQKIQKGPSPKQSAGRKPF